MDYYQILLKVAPTKLKSKYPFIVMNELQIKKTRRYIELEFVNALHAMRKKNSNTTGGNSSDVTTCTNGKCIVMFADF
jgi:hypothetical protein